MERFFLRFIDGSVARIRRLGGIGGMVVSILMLIDMLASRCAYAAQGAEQAIDKADTVWVLISTALVMLMTPGLALFYAGMTRKKNALATMMQSYFILCIITIQWILLGYTLSFGTDAGGVIGSLNFLGLGNVGIEAKGTIPHIVFMIFQGMFAAITVALITGAVAERIKFSAVIIFGLIWSTLVYDPVTHWVWGGGWLAGLGVLDFAGGIVVHVTCGISALVAALVIGKRRGYPREHMPPHNLTLTVIGMGLLWFGWFGFNAGSALAGDGVAAMAFVTTNTAAAAGTIIWVFVEWAHKGKPTILGAMSGSVAGLGSITPAAGYVTPGAAVVIGLAGGVLCYFAVMVLKSRLGYDDTLDVFGIHGIAGTWGTIATGIFASIGAKGLLAGNPRQLLVQAIGAFATAAFTAVATFVIIKAVDMTVGLRVNTEQEVEGLDHSQHGESGYSL